MRFSHAMPACRYHVERSPLHPLESCMTLPPRRRAGHRMRWLAFGAIVVALATILGTVLYLVRSDEPADSAGSETSAPATSPEAAEVTTDLCEEFDASGITDVVPETDTGLTDADIGPDPDNAEIETTLTCWWGDQEQWTGWVLARFWPTAEGAREAVDNDRAGSDAAGIETADYTDGFSAVIAQEDGRELLGLIVSIGRVEVHVFASLDPAVHRTQGMWAVLGELRAQCDGVFADFAY